MRARILKVEKAGAKSSTTVGAALSEAQTIIEAAKRRAQELLAEAEQALQDSTERGYADGFERGLSEASTDAVRLIEDGSQISDRLAEQAARLAVAIASRVVGEHVQVRPETVVSLARAALRQSVVGEAVIIVVHPDDREVVEDVREDLRRIAGGSNVTFDVDPDMRRGGCMIRTDFGEVDASIESLVGAIARKLGVRFDE